jgi:hypothetical protein
VFCRGADVLAARVELACLVEGRPGLSRPCLPFHQTSVGSEIHASRLSKGLGCTRPYVG